jgi:methyl-accepting chemotaxis protein
VKDFFVMKNMKLGGKIGAAFGLVILITMALGAFGIFNMLTVGHDSDQLAKQYLPQVKVANELERHSLLAMYAIRGYGYSLDRSLLKTGRQEVALAEKALSQVLALAKQYPSLAGLSSRHNQALKAINQYKEMIKQTESRDQAIHAGRELLEAAAAQYMEACQDLLNHQILRYEQELTANAPQDRLKERFQKVLLVHHIIDLGNLARLATFKAQSMRDLKFIKQALATFPLIEEDLAQLASYSSDREDYQARATISASTISYRDAIDVLLINWTELQKLNQRRADTASRVLEAASSTALEGLTYTQKVADQASDNLQIATIAVMIGLLAALIIAIILSVFTTRSVIKPINSHRQSQWA